MSRACAPTPAALVRLRAGDPEEYAGLVRRYHPGLLRLARAYVPSHAVAEEVVQETWVAVLRGIDRFEGRSSLKTWIYRILANRARTRGVRENRTLPFSSVGPAEPAGRGAPELEAFGPRADWAFAGRRDPRGSPEKAALDREARREVLGQVRRLPAKQGAVVYLRDVRGWTAPEVCDRMGISEVYQRVLLHRGRAGVRAGLAGSDRAGPGTMPPDAAPAAVAGPTA